MLGPNDRDSVGTEPTFDGIMGPAKPFIQELNQHSDIIGVSYYPMGKNGNVKDPAVVHADFDALVSLYPDKPIYFYQYGYPSSTFLKSSEARQRRFIEETFKAWDRQASHILMIDFTWLHDKSADDTQRDALYYKIPGRQFTEFIGTLGLRTHAGQDKQALRVLKAEAKARGW